MLKMPAQASEITVTVKDQRADSDSMVWQNQRSVAVQTS